MVLSVAAAGGAGRRRTPRITGEDGAQSIEFALTVPFAVLTIALLLHAALFGADLVAANAVALQAARVASTASDSDVRAVIEDAAGGRPVEVTVDPPDGQREVGDLVRTTVRVRSAAFAAFGATVWVPARATLQVERT